MTSETGHYRLETQYLWCRVFRFAYVHSCKQGRSQFDVIFLTILMSLKHGPFFKNRRPRARTVNCEYNRISGRTVRCSRTYFRANTYNFSRSINGDQARSLVRNFLSFWRQTLRWKVRWALYLREKENVRKHQSSASEGPKVFLSCFRYE